MINGVIIKKLAINEDQRGWLAEIFRNDETSFLPAMAYVSVTKPNVARGPHEHAKQSDCFVFVGPGTFALYLWDHRDGVKRKDLPVSSTAGERLIINVGENNPALVIVPPGVVHGYKNISAIDAMSINFPDTLYRGQNKQEEIDEIRWETDPQSPYRIE
jgi:dTDP-4-dehydrorhamnose 3,5-epimerase